MLAQPQGARAAARWRIYRHPECARCARYARTHLRLDWRHLLEESTATPPSGALRMGEVVVQELATGAMFHGAEAMERIAASKAHAITSPKTAIASSAAVRDTALFTPDATPASSVPTAFITVVVSGATVMLMPRPSTQTAGKKLSQ
jgi:hypothetical protein